MLTAAQYRRRATRLLKRASQAEDPDQKVRCEEEARSWQAIARVSRWEELFNGGGPAARILD